MKRCACRAYSVALFTARSRSRACRRCRRECPGGLVCPEGTSCAAKQEVCIKDSCGNGISRHRRRRGLRRRQHRLRRRLLRRLQVATRPAATASSTPPRARRATTATPSSATAARPTASRTRRAATASSTPRGRGLRRRQQRLAATAAPPTASPTRPAATASSTSPRARSATTATRVNGRRLLGRLQVERDLRQRHRRHGQGRDLRRRQQPRLRRLLRQLQVERDVRQRHVDDVTCKGVVLSCATTATPSAATAARRDCKSSEKCGNGSVDKGEECDPRRTAAESDARRRSATRTAPSRTAATATSRTDRGRRVRRRRRDGDVQRQLHARRLRRRHHQRHRRRAVRHARRRRHRHVQRRRRRRRRRGSACCRAAATATPTCAPASSATRPASRPRATPTARRSGAATASSTPRPARQCDDGNTNSNDGCSGTDCKLEPGFACSTQPSGRTACTPICGDGLTVGTEACDDHNTLSCGSCNSTCTQAQPVGPASGSITTVQASSLRDQETVTLSDGATSVTFEFDLASRNGTFNGVQSGHVAVQVVPSGRAPTMPTRSPSS